jgi:hypothetical protein
MLTESCSKVAQNFFCNSCNYNTCKKSSYNKHLITAKHLKLTDVNTKVAHNSNACINCNRIYKSRVGLWSHKKKCDLIVENNINQEILPEPNVINTLINENKSLKEFMVDQNADFKNLILEVCKNFQSSTINNNHNNSHNKTFNLQVFLNETCKDAMNIMDFADSIKLQLTDLENVGEHGFVNGISNIIIKSLQEMDVNLRPVHCSDLKREVAYVKENGKWEKDTPDNKLIKKAIKRVAHRNVRQIPEWRDKYPDCRFSDSKKSDQYNELIIEAMGGRGDNDDEKANKIVKKIIKNVVIDKNMI